MVEIAPLLLGCAAVVGGVLMVVFRVPFGKFTQSSQRGMFGKLGEAASRRDPSNSLAVAGVFGTAVGVILIVFSILR